MLAVGTKVYSMSDGYGGVGVVVGYETNMIGIPLVIVNLDDGSDDACFYSYEVIPIEKESNV